MLVLHAVSMQTRADLSILNPLCIELAEAFLNVASIYENELFDLYCLD